MNAYKRNSPVKKKNLIKNKVFWLIVAVIVILLVGGGIAYKHYRDKKNNSNTPVIPRPTTDKTKNSNTPAATTTPADNSTNSKNNNNSTPAENTPSTMANIPVTKPYGSFISNHKPGQNGSPVDEEASTCSTAAGITCSINFTKDGVTKSLPAKTTDSAGTAYWQWSIKSIGLTTGNWTVTAVATNGQQTESTTDSIPLQVP